MSCTSCLASCVSRCATCNGYFLCDNCILTTMYVCELCSIHLYDDVNRLRLNIYQYTTCGFQRDSADTDTYSMLLVQCNLLSNNYQYDPTYTSIISIYKKILLNSHYLRKIYVRLFIFVSFVSAGLTIYLGVRLIKITSLVSIFAWIISWWAVCRDIMKTGVSHDNPSGDALHYTLGRGLIYDIILTIVFFTLTIIALHTIMDLILLLSYLTFQAANYTVMYKLRPVM